MRQKLINIIVGLEVYALLLANLQALGGVRTDEAKYLLSIPYPHPPLLRWIMHLTEFVPFQEMLWRFLLASLVIQAVWFVWDLSKDLDLEDRMALCGGWLLSSAVILQAGSIMLAPVSAVQMLVFLWLRRQKHVERYAGFIALFWFASLFTAFQAILFLPFIIDVFARMTLPRREKIMYVALPILLLTLYSFSNPLVLAGIAIHGSGGLHSTLMDRALGVGTLWVFGGSLVLGLVGTAGVLRSRDPFLLSTFALVILFDAVSVPYPYYAILFTPLFIEGTRLLLKATTHRRFFFRDTHTSAFPLLTFLIGASVVIVFLRPPPLQPTNARAVMQAIAARGNDGDIAIQGSFGHEWQYESPFFVERYRTGNIANVQAIVCLNHCPTVSAPERWKKMEVEGVEVWVVK